MPGIECDFRLVFFIVIFSSVPEVEIDGLFFPTYLTASEISFENPHNKSCTFYINLSHYSQVLYTTLLYVIKLYSSIKDEDLIDQVDSDDEDYTIIFTLSEDQIIHFRHLFRTEALSTRLGNHLYQTYSNIL